MNSPPLYRSRSRSRSPLYTEDISPTEMRRRQLGERGMSPEELRKAKSSRMPRGLGDLMSRFSLADEQPRVKPRSRRTARIDDMASIMDIDIRERTVARERQRKIQEEKERKEKEEAEARERRAQEARERRETRKQTKKGVDDITALLSAFNVEPKGPDSTGSSNAVKGGKSKSRTTKEKKNKK